MDNASDYESGDSRFESWQRRNILSHAKIDFIPNIAGIIVYFNFVALWPNG